MTKHMTKPISDELHEIAKDLGNLAKQATARKIGMQPLTDRLLDMQLEVHLLADKTADSEVRPRDAGDDLVDRWVKQDTGKAPRRAKR